MTSIKEKIIKYLSEQRREQICIEISKAIGVSNKSVSGVLSKMVKKNEIIGGYKFINGKEVKNI